MLAMMFVRIELSSPVTTHATVWTERAAPWLEIFLTLFRLAPESCSSPGPIKLKWGTASSRAAQAWVWPARCCSTPPTQ